MPARLLTVVFAYLALLALPAAAQEPPPSNCLMIAGAISKAVPVSYRRIAESGANVTLTYAGHSTYVIETPKGVRIATDFSGMYGAEPLPRIVTMNNAHSTHYTDSPDPRIEHVLRGWGENGQPARHNVVVEDVYVRNVTTDILRYGRTEANANSIFIFEVAGLCIGHLGHLHHALTDAHYAAIGRLDVVMVPIDGGLTMSLSGMSEITRRLHASVVLPMHRHATPIDAFTGAMSDAFAIDFRDSRSLTLSRATLPPRPTIVVLSGV